MADEPHSFKGQDDNAGDSPRNQWHVRADKLVRIGNAIGYRLYRLVGESFAIISALAIITFYVSALFLERQQGDLSMLRPNIALWFSQSFDGASAEVGELDLTWLPSQDRVRFTARDVRVFDRQGREIQNLAELRIISSRESVARLSPDLHQVEIDGGEVTWLRRSNGTTIAGLGTPETVGGFGPLYRGRSDNPEVAGLSWLEGFERLAIRNSLAHIINKENGLGLRLQVEELVGETSDAGSSLSVSASLLSENAFAGMEVSDEPRDDDGSFYLKVDADPTLTDFDIGLSVEAVRPDRLAPPRGRGEALLGIGLPVSANAIARYSRESGLSFADLDLSTEAGTLTVAGEDREIEAIGFSGRLTPGDEIMTVERLDVASPYVSFVSSGAIREIGRLYDGDIGTSPKFDLDIDEATLNFMPTFEAPIRLSSSQVLGELDLDDRKLSLERFRANFGDFALGGSLLFQTRDEGGEQLSIDGEALTDLTPQHVLSLWPVQMADGARRWVENSVVGGIVDDLEYRVDLDRAFFDDPQLTEDRLRLDLSIKDGHVRYIQTMTPLTDAVGTGSIFGNRLEMNLESGQIGMIPIQQGRVDIPRLVPHGGDILIEASTEAPAEDLLALINQPPFQYMDRYGVSPEGFGGDARLTLSVKRPLLEFFDQDRIEYSVDGTFTDASIPFRIGPYMLSEADVTLRGGKEGLFVSGPANLGPWRAQIDWAERYGQNGEPTRYRVSGMMDRRTLDGFGIGFRNAFDGTLQLDLEATGQGINVEQGILSVDLTDAEMALGDIWTKPIGQPGQMSADLRRNEDGITFEQLSLSAPGMNIVGQVRMRSDFALLRADFETLAIDSLVNGSASVARSDDGQAIVVQAEGKSLDVSPWVQRALRREGEEINLPLILNAEFADLRLSPDYALSGALINYRHDGEAVRQTRLSGTRQSGQVDISLTESDDATRAVSISIPDMSLAANAFLGLQSTRDGALSLSADLPASGESGAILGSAEVTDFSVQNAPFLAQILSLASLTGLSDTLSGEGLSFDALEFDFAYRPESIALREARLYGPALGMTGEGDINLEQRTLDFDGTLAPAYSANSFLSDIPLIGDVFGGGEGEGVLALTYSVNGPFSGANIAINPLSAITPGFMRGIFGKDRDDISDDLVDDIEDIRPDPDAEAED